MTITSLQIPAPKDWQAFERLCRDLWEHIWDDEYSQQNGRGGQRQNGVDVFGRNRKDQVTEGVQCKGKDGRYDSALTIPELEGEVKKALSFTPQLGRFILATSGQTDVAVQERARQISEEHKASGKFSVEIQSWDHIQNRFLDFPDVFAFHYQHIFESVLRIAAARANKPLIAIRHQSQEATSPSLEHIDTKILGRPVLPIDCDASLTYENGVMNIPAAALLAEQKLVQEITANLKRYPESEVAYYGVAHIPLVMHAGTVVSNKRTIRIFELHRHSGEFIPIALGDGLDLGESLTDEGGPNDARDAVIRIGISYPIPIEDIQAVIDRPFRSWKLNIACPRIDAVTHEGQLEKLASNFRQVLDIVHNDMPAGTPLHVFCAGPVSSVFRLGQTISRTIHGPVYVYNYSSRETPKYSWAIDVNASADDKNKLWRAAGTA